MLLAVILITASSRYYLFVLRDKSVYHFSPNEQKLITAVQCLQKNLYFPESIRIYDATLKQSDDNSSYVVLANYSALTLGNTYKSERIYIKVDGDRYDIQREPGDNATNEEILDNAEYTFAMFKYINDPSDWISYDDLSVINKYLQSDTVPNTYVEISDEY